MLIFLGIVTYVPEISLWLPARAWHALIVFDSFKQRRITILVTEATLSKL